MSMHASCIQLSLANTFLLFIGELLHLTYQSVKDAEKATGNTPSDCSDPRGFISRIRNGR